MLFWTGKSLVYVALTSGRRCGSHRERDDVRERGHGDGRADVLEHEAEQFAGKRRLGTRNAKMSCFEEISNRRPHLRVSVVRSRSQWCTTRKESLTPEIQFENIFRICDQICFRTILNGLCQYQR